MLAATLYQENPDSNTYSGMSDQLRNI